MQKEYLEKMHHLQASYHVLQMKLLHFHWLVKGRKFLPLHTLFEEHYKHAHIMLDDLAERLLAMHQKPLCTLKAALEHSFIHEVHDEISTDDMIRFLIEDYMSFKAHQQEIIPLCGDVHDHVTEEMIVSHQAFFDKQRWILEAHLV